MKALVRWETDAETNVPCQRHIATQAAGGSEADSAEAIECERLVILDLHPSWSLIVGRVLAMHVRDDAVMDPAKLDLIGRMHGRGLYARTRDLFDMRRILAKGWTRGAAQ